jgi:hypothetical protein
VPTGELTSTLTIARVAHQTCCTAVCLQKTSSEHIWCWHWISKCIRRCQQCNQQKARCMGPARWPHLIGGWLAPASVGSPINTLRNFLQNVGTPSMLRGKYFRMLVLHKYFIVLVLNHCFDVSVLRQHSFHAIAISLQRRMQERNVHCTAGMVGLDAVHIAWFVPSVS